MKLGEVVRMAGKRAQEMRESGAAPLYTGLPGMLALMQDNIRRFFTGSQEEDEVLDLAGSAILALSMVLEDINMPDEDFDARFEEAIDEEEPEEYRVEDDAPTLGPVPIEHEGWQLNQAKAIAFELWLTETGRWDLLSVEQQTGILRAVQGDLDTTTNKAGVGEYDEAP